MNFMRNPLLAFGALCASAVPGAAQIADGNNSTFVPAGGTATLDHFNSCIVVTNPTNHDAQYEFNDANEWAGFVAHPNAGVKHTACTCSNPNGSPPLTEGQTVSVIVPTGSIPCPAGDTGSELTSNTVVEKCVAGALVPISSTPNPPNASTCSVVICQVGAFTGTAGNNFTTSVASTETCAAAGLAGDSGQATDTVVTPFFCDDNGNVTQTGPPMITNVNTSQCVAGGGSCVPLTQAEIDACNAHNTTNAMVSGPDGPIPICQWTPAVHTQSTFPLTFLQSCWQASQNRSHAFFQVSSDGCSCTSEVITDTPVALQVQFKCGDTAPPPNLPSPSCTPSEPTALPTGCAAPTENPGESFIAPIWDPATCPGPSGNQPNTEPQDMLDPAGGAKIN